MNTTFSATGAPIPSLYTIAPTPAPIPLPVELVSFKAQRHAQGVQLTWATASEQDNSGFEVQVSTDARAFHTLGFVRSEVGTTSMAQRYTFLDTRAVSGTRYYRLAQVDLDGTTTLSSVQAVSLDGGNGAVTAYPNPFENVITVKLNGGDTRKVHTILSNAHGQVILNRQQEVTGTTLTIDTGHVTHKGIYILHVIESDGTKHTFKLMKN
ncbi:T9SS type A sorting domain-containing protein [Pontibacter roseus]|uniref:T9SS type A sorting domain-containing protein n=1 Tax=Pontibacter roseus TaxID=336989 RepID=UPI0012F8B73B|nr:T9SS type A sorting domain-containing protein [Pontibacter roseus]